MTLSDDQRKQLVAIRIAKADSVFADVTEFTAEQVAAMLEQARCFVAEVKSLL